MRYRTARLLTGATLTLLAVACAATLGTATASATSQHANAKAHKISACGFVATKAGTYELTQNVVDAGSGPCITLNGDHITLYLDSYTITGTGTDVCLLVGGLGSAENIGETIVGGTVKKPARPATLSSCHAGIEITRTSGTMISHINISSPAGDGVLETLAGGMTLSNINVQMHAVTTAIGIFVEAGSDNTVTKSLVNTNGTAVGIVAESEVGDSFTYNSVVDTYNSSGNTATGMADVNSSRDTWSHNVSSGQKNGYVFSEDGSGPVTATYNTAKGHATSGSVGFHVTNAFQLYDPGSQHHTLLSHNKSVGFEQGFLDSTDTPYSAAETWASNTATNYTEYGFFIESPGDYTMTGNIADANPAGKKYTGGSTCGFCLAGVSPLFSFMAFSKNQAYDNLYGFDSGGTFVGGKGNIAKRNKYNALNVEIDN